MLFDLQIPGRAGAGGGGILRNWSCVLQHWKWKTGDNVNVPEWRLDKEYDKLCKEKLFILQVHGEGHRL